MPFVFPLVTGFGEQPVAQSAALCSDRRAKMRSKAILLIVAAALTACPSKSDGPLPPDQLAIYQQGCVVPTDCVLARNQPKTCCGDSTFANVVVVSRAEINNFERQFEEPDCSDVQRCVPPIDDAVLENRFEVGCSNNTCTITEEHPNTGQACNNNLPCPSGYECEAETCLFRGEPESCELMIEPPIMSGPPGDPTPPALEPCRTGWRAVAGPGDGSHCEPWLESGEGDCGDTGAEFPNESGCELIFDPCGIDGLPTDLPNDGTPIVLVPPGGSIVAAIDGAMQGSIIVTSTGTFVESPVIDKDVTIWGCGEATELRGTVNISTANVHLRNLIVRGGVTSGVFSDTSVAHVLIFGSWTSSDGARGMGQTSIVRGGVEARGGAMIDLGRVVVERGVSAEGTGTQVRLFNAVLSRNGGGAGISVGFGASITARAVAIEENGYAGIYANGGTIDADEVHVVNNGFGALATGGMVTVSHAYFASNRDASIVASGSSSTIMASDVAIASTLSSGGAAAGLISQDGASLDVQRAIVSESIGVAVTINGEAASATIEDLEISGVRAVGERTSAITVFSGGRLVLESARARDVAGTGLIVSHEGTSCDLLFVRFEDLAEDGMYVDAGARLDAQIISIARAHHTGVYVGDTATSATLEALTINDVSDGVGLAVAYGASAVIDQLEVSAALLAGVFITEPGTEVSLKNAKIHDNEGRGISIQHGAVVELQFVELSRNQQVGLLSLSPLTSVTASDLSIEECGLGAAAYREGALELDRFWVRKNMIAGLARGPSSVLSLGGGRVEDNPLGLSVEGSINAEGVCFRGNTDDSNTTDLGLPAPLELDGR